MNKIGKPGKKNLSSFGFIVELLDISVTEIADRIYVTQSLVSKWKNGVRSLKKSSEYYEKVISYFLAQNEKNGQKTLENLFSTLYAQEDPNEENYLHNCLHKFLSNEDVPVMARSLLYETRRNLYSSSISVFIAKEGRRSAFSMLLDSAASMDPGEISIVEREQFSWLLDDPDYAEEWKEGMLGLLDAGWHISLVHFISPGAVATVAFLREFHPVLFHKNLTEYYYHYYFERDCAYSHYLLGGQMSLLGLNPDGRDESMYTAIYRDPFSMLQHQRIVENLVRRCTTVFKIYSGNHMQPVLDKLKSYEVRREMMFVSSRLPVVSALDEEGFEELLRQNSVSGKQRNRCLTMHKLLRRTILSGASRHIYSMESIRRATGMEELTLCTVSEIAERRVVMSQSLYRRHLRCLAQLIESTPSFQVGLAGFDDELVEDAGIWCKENMWHLSFDNERVGIAKFSEEPVVVNTLAGVLRKQWENLPPELRERANVAKILREAGEE